MNIKYFMLLRHMQILLLLLDVFIIKTSVYDDNENEYSNQIENSSVSSLPSSPKNNSDHIDVQNLNQINIPLPSVAEIQAAGRDQTRIPAAGGGYNPAMDSSSPQPFHQDQTTHNEFETSLITSTHEAIESTQIQINDEFKTYLITPTYAAIESAKTRIDELQDYIREQKIKTFNPITQNVEDFLNKIMQEAENLYSQAEENYQVMVEEITKAQKYKSDPHQYLSAIVQACNHAITTIKSVIALHNITTTNYTNYQRTWPLFFSGHKKIVSNPFEKFNTNIIKKENENIINQLESSLIQIKKYAEKKQQEAALAIKKYQNKQAEQQKMVDRAKIENAKIRAEALIKNSYFSPEMQYLVLACCAKKFIINVVTGKVQNLPTIQELIHSNPVDNNLKINALQAALEAVRIATVCAGLDAAYAQPEYLGFMPSLKIMPGVDEPLTQALKTIKKQLDTALQTALSKRPWTAKYIWSWIPESLQDYIFINPNKALAFDNSFVPIPENINTDNVTDENNFVTIPPHLIKQIIKINDYKQLNDATLIAQLLFKQIFIAQQPLLPGQGNSLFEICNFQNNSPITSTNYIFNNFNDFETIKTNAIQSIDKVDTNLKNQQKLYVRDAILRMRKAVQTAIYVANTHRNYYLGYTVPYIFTQISDRAISQLVAYDNQLVAAMRDKTTDFMLANDLARDNLWSNITIILAAGAGIYAAAKIGEKSYDYIYGQGAAAQATSQVGTNIKDNLSAYLPPLPDINFFKKSTDDKAQEPTVQDRLSKFLQAPNLIEPDLTQQAPTPVKPSGDETAKNGESFTKNPSAGTTESDLKTTNDKISATSSVESNFFDNILEFLAKVIAPEGKPIQ